MLDKQKLFLENTGPKILITFDDGHISNYNFASKILDDLNIKASFFIPINVINRNTEDKIIKGWFKRIVKKNEHLMYEYSNYKSGSGANGTPKRAHNHALSSAMSHMQLGILLSDKKLFRKAFKNFEAAIKYQRKDGSMPIETRRGGRAMFYQARAMNALAVIAMLAENQGYNIWDYDYKGKNYHVQLLKLYLQHQSDQSLVQVEHYVVLFCKK